jgi:hypothetical protein
VNIKAEQLAGYRKHYLNITTNDHFQLKTIALLFMIAAEIHNWTEKEEEIVMSLEEERAAMDKLIETIAAELQTRHWRASNVRLVETYSL